MLFCRFFRRDLHGYNHWPRSSKPKWQSLQDYRPKRVSHDTLTSWRCHVVEWWRWRFWWFSFEWLSVTGIHVDRFLFYNHFQFQPWRMRLSMWLTTGALMLLRINKLMIQFHWSFVLMRVHAFDFMLNNYSTHMYNQFINWKKSINTYMYVHVHVHTCTCMYSKCTCAVRRASKPLTGA